MLKKIGIFYLFLILPFITLVQLTRAGYLTSMAFTVCLFALAFIYRPVICGARLVQADKIAPKEFWKNFIPYWNSRYAAYLFFGK